MPSIPSLKRRMATSRPAQNANDNSGVLRFSVAFFLVALVLLYVTAPFVEQFQGGVLIEAALMTLVLSTAVMAVGGHRRTLVWAMAFTVPAMAEKWLHYWWPDLLPPHVSMWTGLLGVGFIVLNLLRFILKAPRVNSEVLCAGVATYLLLGLLWAFAYILVAQINPDSFAFTVGPVASHSLKGFNSLYFSITTLATSSYGDIIPVSGIARMLAMMQSVVGMFYVTLLIARLVSLYSSQGLSEDRNDPIDNRLAEAVDKPESALDSLPSSDPVSSR
ncbi:putative Ion transport 2 domain protein [Candidatus Contendobacter odensis Run_B_J11]|uniref:Ion transport 2 domain protein n=2 Tax=Candidatus Contendibacter odensensis TaxID=1400860 RepID=A0A7U7GF49_9GAMM|nr:putative Ion transport 2 domain protein [Candidatus Contendobacter odensis Run_B_J11]